MKRICSLLLIVIWSCTSSPSSSPSSSSLKSSALHHAQKFQITTESVIVTEPWPGATTPISYPLSSKRDRIVVTSTTHLPYLELLGLEDRLVGFPNTAYISSPVFRERVENGQITDLGPDGSINMELLLATQPDVVFVFDMGAESGSLDKIREAGIPIVYNSDFLEPTTLGRAEWIKFFGAYFDRSILADSIFSGIETRYDSLKNLASTVSYRPTVLSGILYGDVWFMPGGQNWGARFFEDAGGSYLWGNDPNTGWLELSFESVYDQAKEADFWIGVGSFDRLDQLKSEDNRYSEFKPFASQKVYNYSKRKSPFGGYDFFESGYARPDVVLADLIKILHPELMPGYSLYYYEALL